METMRDIQIRMKSIDSTRQITESMRLISNRKVQKIKKRMEDNRSYYEQSAGIISRMMNDPAVCFDIKNHIYIAGHSDFKEKEKENGGVETKPKKSVVLVITGDRGLCGGYNSNVQKEAFSLIKELPDVKIVAVGMKGRDYFRRRQQDVVESYKGLSENPFYEDAQNIGEAAIKMFADKEADEIYLVYTEYKTMLQQTPKTVRLLPLDSDGIANKANKTAKPEKIERGENVSAGYDSGAEKFFKYAAETYIVSSIFGAMLESAVSEQCARMTGMDAAVKNSKKIIDSLTLRYNQMRQSAITQEIAEIVGGANAVGKD